MKRRAVKLLGIAVVLACSDVDQATAPAIQAAALDADAYEVIDLGLFGTTTQAFGLDDQARTVMGRYVRPGEVTTRSFVWTKKDGFTDLGEIDGMPFQLLKSNKHGLLTGWVPTLPTLPPPGVIQPLRAAVRLPHGEFRYVDNPDFAGQTSGVNNHGVVVGFRNRLPLPSPPAAFRWTEKDGLTLIPLTHEREIVRSSASDINDNGIVLGAVSIRTPTGGCCQDFPFLWDDQRGMRLLPKLSESQFGATDVNNSDVVVGAGFTRLPLPGERVTNPLTFFPGDVPTHAWRWSEARGLEDLGTLGGKHSVAWAVDDDGNAYGWAMKADGLQLAVKWTWDGRTIELGTLGGSSQTGAVNKHGVLAGQSQTLSGERHAVLFIPKKK